MRVKLSGSILPIESPAIGNRVLRPFVNIPRNFAIPLCHLALPAVPYEGSLQHAPTDSKNVGCVTGPAFECGSEATAMCWQVHVFKMSPLLTQAPEDGRGERQAGIWGCPLAAFKVAGV